ncbi:MAG: thioredoxin domain-containing protein, partial [Polyangiaceae bacterium]|nr:thioredoxin domain-containing protein [Polyangiaceae bacterium]
GTPHTYVNGIAIGGAQPFEKFKSVIDEELRKADLIVAAGGSRSKIYGVLSKANFETKKEEPELLEPEDDTSTVWKVPVAKDSIVQGDPNAPVTVILFSDMECPFCRRLEVGGLKKVREEYKEKVRIVWKNEPLPFHSRAKAAANFAMEARAQKGDAAFWKAHDLLMNLSDNDASARSKLSDEDMVGFAAKLGLDAAKVKAAIKGNKYQKQIGADMALGDAFDVKGTPHMFINGRRLVGSMPFEKFKEIIDQELAKAQALTKAGVAAKSLYNELTKDGRVLEVKSPEKKAVVAPPGAPFRGGANAKVVIQQFSDFECPFCSRVEPTLDEVLKKYGNKVKIVWRNLPLPFHPHAVEAAEAAAEAHKQKGSKGFWAMHSLIFKNQRALERSDLDGYAKTIGLDPTKFAAAMNGKGHRTSIDTDAKAAKDANISGTPGFLINGYFLSGAQPIEKFEALIDRALLEAK